MTNFSVSQNFVRKSALIEQLVNNANFSKDELVIDIGAGRGVITEALSKVCNHVIAIEPDARLAELLRQRFAAFNVDVVEQDFVSQFILPKTNFSVFANIPFNKTADIMRKMLSVESALERGYIFLQREAIYKIAGEQVGAKNSMLSVINSILYDFEIVHDFDRRDFEPMPNVDISLLEIVRRTEPVIGEIEYRIFLDFVAYLFNKSVPDIFHCKDLVKKQYYSEIQRVARVKGTEKPTELKIEQVVDLFDLLKSKPEFRIVNGYYNKIESEQRSLQKSHRTRLDARWRG